MTIWPILLVVFSNVFYHICAKLSPRNVNPLLVVIASYITGAIAAMTLYLLTRKPNESFFDVKNLNWAVFLFGIAIVGLEIGNIYMYKAGWKINTGYMVQSAMLAVALLAVGALLFKESVTFTKLMGTAICLIGLYFINK